MLWWNNLTFAQNHTKSLKTPTDYRKRSNKSKPADSCHLYVMWSLMYHVIPITYYQNQVLIYSGFYYIVLHMAILKKKMFLWKTALGDLDPGGTEGIFFFFLNPHIKKKNFIRKVIRTVTIFISSIRFSFPSSEKLAFI